MTAAKERGCCLELNAEPNRLDLTDVAVNGCEGFGRENSDLDGCAFDRRPCLYALWRDQARRGWLEPDDVINTRPLRELKKLIRR